MVLITGGTGLIGAHLILECLRNGDEVRAIHRRSSDLNKVLQVFRFWSGDGESLFRKIEWFEADVLDTDAILRAMEGCDLVYHCAAMVSFHPKDFDQMMEVNQQGTANVVNACLKSGIQELCYISSVAALGRHESGRAISEDSEWKSSPANSQYAISKYNAELEVWRGMEEGLNVVMVNPTVVVGPGDINLSSSKIFQVVRKGMPFYTRGMNGFVDVRDVAECMRELVVKGIRGERFVLVGENMPFREMMNHIARNFKKPLPKYHLHPRIANIGARVLSLVDRIFGTKSNLTRESVRNSGKSFVYDGSKIERTLERKMRPIAPIVQETCRFVEHQ